MEYPSPDAKPLEQRLFKTNTLTTVIAKLLNEVDLPCNVFLDDGDSKPDYTKWNVTLDGSITSAYQKEGFCE